LLIRVNLAGLLLMIPMTGKRDLCSLAALIGAGEKTVTFFDQHLAPC
jgi:hypothetical protein